MNFITQKDGSTAMSDEQILDLLIETDGNAWAVAEALVDSDVASGKYEGCSSELEMAFCEYEARAERVLARAGG